MLVAHGYPCQHTLGMDCVLLILSTLSLSAELGLKGRYRRSGLYNGVGVPGRHSSAAVLYITRINSFVYADTQ